jgi:hypothetical protein
VIIATVVVSGVALVLSGVSVGLIAGAHFERRRSDEARND